jgi:hypothetical protein
VSVEIIRADAAYSGQLAPLFSAYPDWAGCDIGRRLMYTASEKLAIIRLVEDSELSIRRTLVEINVS